MKKEEIKNQIEELNKELQKIEENEFEESINLDNFTDAEKISKFDELYNSALHLFNSYKENTKYDMVKPNYEHGYEILLGILSKDSGKFWDYYNSL